MKPTTTVNARPGNWPSCEIVATGHCYPSQRISNEDFFARCRFPITDDREKLIRQSKMESRFWCADNENTWTMARQAVDMVLSSSAVKATDIDVVIVSS